MPKIAFLEHILRFLAEKEKARKVEKGLHPEPTPNGIPTWSNVYTQHDQISLADLESDEPLFLTSWFSATIHHTTLNLMFIWSPNYSVLWH